MEFDYERFRRIARNYVDAEVINLVTDDGRLADMDESPPTIAELLAQGLVRQLLEMHQRNELPEMFNTDA